MRILKRHLDKIIWTCVFILSFVGAVFAQDCSPLLDEYFSTIKNKNIHIELTLDQNTIQIKFNQQNFVINDFHRLQIKPHDLKDFLQTLSEKELEDEMDILKRLTSEDKYSSTTTSENEFIFSDIFKKNMNILFMKKGISTSDKLDYYFKFYWEKRLSMLDSSQREQLKNIFDDMGGTKLLLKDEYKNHHSFYSSVDHKVVTRDRYHYKIVELIVKVHEAEHAITRILNPAFNNLSAINYKEIKISKRFKKLHQLHSLLNEGNSIAAQWEFVQHIPEELRNQLFFDLSIHKGEIPNIESYPFMDSEIEMAIRTKIKKEFNENNVALDALNIGGHSLYYANFTKKHFINTLRKTHGYELELIDGNLVFD